MKCLSMKHFTTNYFDNLQKLGKIVPGYGKPFALIDLLVLVSVVLVSDVLVLQTLINPPCQIVIYYKTLPATSPLSSTLPNPRF